MAGWLRAVYLRCGPETSGQTAQVQAIVAHNDGEAGGFPLLWSGAAKPVSVRMVDRTGGAELSWTGITDVLIAANTAIVAGMRNDAAVLTYGQSNGPVTMYFDDTAPSVPDPFPTTGSGHYHNTQGEIDIQIVTQDNRAPSAAIAAPGSVTADPTPTITVAFSDPDAAYGDAMSAWQIEVWNPDRTQRLQNTNKQPATAPQQAAAAASWTAATLAPGAYLLRAYVWDAAGRKSEVAEQTVTINAGGAVVNVRPNGAAGTRPDGTLVFNTANPETATATWTHQSGVATDTLYWRIVNALGEVVREEATYHFTVAAGSDYTNSWDGPGWPALPAGAARYRWQSGALDALGGWSGWTSSAPFEINSAPTAALSAPADGIAFAQPPEIVSVNTDLTDEADALSVMHRVRLAGDTVWVDVAASYDAATGTHRSPGSAAQFPSLGDYEVQVAATDPWGLSATSAIATVHYVAAPAITSVSPADDSTVTTGTPTVTAAVDRTVSQQRITITAQGGTRLYHDSGVVAGSGPAVSLPVPGATLPNDTDYDLTIWVRTSDGLEATSVTRFRVAYAAPWYLAGVIAAAVGENLGDGGGGIAPAQLPDIRVRCDRVDESAVGDEDWLGYVYYVINGVTDRRFEIADRNETTLLITDAPAGVTTSIYAGYRQRINDGLDEITSRLTRVDAVPDLKHATLTSEGGAVPGVVFHFWDTRGVPQQTAAQAVEILGQAEPDGWQGPADYDELDIDVLALNAADGSFTAQDVLERARALARPRTIALGDGREIQAPHDLTYRDPRGRVLPLLITRAPDADDAHRADRTAFRLAGTQVRRETLDASGVDTAAARNMTNVVEPTLLLTFDGTLAGEDRQGPV